MEFALSPKIVLRDARGLCLALQRSADSSFEPGSWDLPGGKLEPGEDFIAGLRREALEETGLAIEIERALGVGERRMDGLYIAVLVLEGRVAGGTLRLSHEHQAHRWVPRRELANLPFCEHLRTVMAAYSREG